MPVIHKSTLRSARQAERRRDRNKATLSAVKTLVKKVQSAVAEKKTEDAKTALRAATSALGTPVTRGARTPHTAVRRERPAAVRTTPRSRSSCVALVPEPLLSHPITISSL